MLHRRGLAARPDTERSATEQLRLREGPLRIEGLEDATCVLLDFGPFVAHVFHQDTRSFYEIERLWSDVPRLEFDDAPDASHSAGA